MMTALPLPVRAIVLTIVSVAALGSHATGQLRLIRETYLVQPGQYLFEVPATGPDGSTIGFSMLGVDNMEGNPLTGRWTGLAVGQANGASASRAIVTGVGVDPTSIRAVVLEGNPSPEGGAFNFNLYDRPRISSNGDIAFASLWGPSLQSWGVYSLDASSGAIVRQVGSGDSLPGFRNVPLNRFVQIAGMTDDGRAAILATSLQNLPGGTTALLLGNQAIAVPGVTPVADPSGVPAGTLSNIFGAAVNSSGQYIVHGGLLTNGISTPGIIVDGVSVIRQGDQLGAAQASGFGSFGMNDHGDWVATAETTAGARVVFNEDGVLMQTGDAVRRLDGTAAGSVASIAYTSPQVIMANGDAILTASIVDEFGVERNGIVRSDGRLLLLEGDRVITDDPLQAYFVGFTPLGAIVGEDMLISTLLRDQNGVPTSFGFIAVTIPAPSSVAPLLAGSVFAIRRRRR